MLFLALIHIPLADTVTIQFSRPLIMVVIAVLILREMVGLKRGFITVIGFTGILMITKPFGEGFDRGHWLQLWEHALEQVSC